MYRLDKGSEPRILGLGTVQEQPAEQGRLFKVSMPGLGIRFSYLTSGLSLGWHESLVFCVDKPGDGEGIDCIADQGFSVGLDISGGGLTLGTYRAIRIPLPDTDAIVQRIHYSQDRPGKTQIERRKLQ